MSGLSPAGPPGRHELEAWLRAGVEAVSPQHVLADVLASHRGTFQIASESVPPGVGVVGLAIGKAACAMARELSRAAGPLLRRGLAITKQDHAFPLEGWEVREASHPVPDGRSTLAAHAAMSLVREMNARDVLVVLLSGGASSLTALPIEGVSLDELAGVGAWLLACGADIEEMNCVRKHLGAFGGGRLALAAAAARIHLLAISDVRADRLDVIGSGPCTGDASTWSDAFEVVRRYGGLDRLPAGVIEALERGVSEGRGETPKPEDPRLSRVRAEVVATNTEARHAACGAARRAGWAVVDGGTSLCGEAREVGAGLVAEARSVLAGVGERGVYVAGGETTVTLRGDGRGGRCQELALAAALAEQRHADWSLLAAGSDGGDGPTDAAGAHSDGETIARGRMAGRSGAEALASNDSYGFFAEEGGVLRTGPTQTNVMDLVFVGVDRRSSS